MNWRSGRQWLAFGAVALLSASALAPRGPRRRLPLGLVRRLRRATGRSPSIAAAVRKRGRGPGAAPAEARPRSYPAVQAYCVRTCDGRYFPISAPTVKAGRRPATVSARPAKPRWSMAAISTMPRPRPESPIPNCRTPSGIATSWWRDAPATARIRSGLRRSRSRTIRHCARAIIVAGANGLMVAGRRADRRGAALNFSPVSSGSARAISACRWWRAIVAIRGPPFRCWGGLLCWRLRRGTASSRMLTVMLHDA